MKNEIDSFELWIEETEIRLRGKCLMLSIDAEWLMLMLISSCYKNNMKEVNTFFKTSKGKKKGIKDLTFEEIIIVCEAGLKKYHPTIHDKIDNVFEEINKLRKIRNKFAHHKIDSAFCKKDKTELTFHMIHNNKFIVRSDNFKITKLEKELINYQKKLGIALAALMKILNISPEELS